MEPSIGTPQLYGIFSLLVIGLLAIDFLLLRTQGSHRVSTREALGWSVAWVSVAFVFAVWLWWYVDAQFGRTVANDKTLEYLTGYLVEKSLAVDNVFVWITIFSFFRVPAEFQKRILAYGVIGAIVMRGLLIYVGALLLAKFHWVLYVFGAFLVFTGIKMLIFAGHEPDIGANPVLRWLRGHMRITDDYAGERFVVVRNGLRHATPMLLVLVLVEVTDVVFAVDSIPAIFAVTSDPFIVFTSNIFAILGLRAMYFLLADMAERFHLLKYGLAVVLMFIGVKMLLLDVYKIPTTVALAVVLVILALTMAASILTNRTVKTGEENSGAC